MALFEKKSQYEKMLEMFKSLSDEEKAKFADTIKAPATKPENTPAQAPVEAPEKEEDENVETPETEAPESTEPAESETTPEAEDNSTEGEEIIDVETEATGQEKTEELSEGLEARLKALEDKFDAILSSKEDEKDKDFGVSGMGKTESEPMGQDNRSEEVLKKLGGRA